VLRKVETRTGKTLLELSSAQEIIKLFQEEGNLKWSGCDRTSGRKSHHGEIPAQIERKEGTWIQVITGRRKILKKTRNEVCTADINECESI
jgi:hypothetical protein